MMSGSFQLRPIPDRPYLRFYSRDIRDAVDVKKLLENTKILTNRPRIHAYMRIVYSDQEPETPVSTCAGLHLTLTKDASGFMELNVLMEWLGKHQVYSDKVVPPLSDGELMEWMVWVQRHLGSSTVKVPPPSEKKSERPKEKSEPPVTLYRNGDYVPKKGPLKRHEWSLSVKETAVEEELKRREWGASAGHFVGVVFADASKTTQIVYVPSYVAGKVQKAADARYIFYYYNALCRVKKLVGWAKTKLVRELQKWSDVAASPGNNKWGIVPENTNDLVYRNIAGKRASVSALLTYLGQKEQELDRMVTQLLRMHLQLLGSAILDDRVWMFEDDPAFRDAPLGPLLRDPSPSHLNVTASNGPAYPVEAATSRSKAPVPSSGRGLSRQKVEGVKTVRESTRGAATEKLRGRA